MDEISSATQLKSILESLGYNLSSVGDFYRTTANYRQSTRPGSLSINKRTGKYYDFGISQGGSLQDLIELTTGKKELDINFIPEEKEEKLDTNVYFDKSILDTLIPDFDFFRDKKISFETMMKFSSGFCQSWKLRNRIVFPIFDRKMRIIGLDGRYYKQNPPENVVRWKLLGRKNNFIYPWHLSQESIKLKREVILVESIGDCLALAECNIYNVLVIFGTKPSAKLLNFIVECDPLKIILALNDDSTKNNDCAGNNGAIQIQNKLTKLFSEDKIVIKLPIGYNDLSDMLSHGSKTEILNWYNN